MFLHPVLPSVSWRSFATETNRQQALYVPKTVIRYMWPLCVCEWHAISVSMSRASNAAFAIADCLTAIERSVHTRWFFFSSPSRFSLLPVSILINVSGYCLCHCVGYICEKEKYSPRNDNVFESTPVPQVDDEKVESN